MLRLSKLTAGVLFLMTVSALADVGSMPQAMMETHHGMQLSGTASNCSADLGKMPPAAVESGSGMGEHVAVLGLVPLCSATNTAVSSGSWTEPATWKDRQVPNANARVSIPAGIVVQLGEPLHGGALDWVRVDGRLSFASDADTLLETRTLVVTDTGRLTIGSTPDPIRTGVHARLVIAPRNGRDRQADPYDLGGGLISLGQVDMVGAGRTSHVGASLPPKQGMQELALDEPERGWQIGDQIVVPGLDLVDDQDENRTIASIADDGRAIGLDRPLSFDHVPPPGISVPIGNLSRNIEVSSAETTSLASRGHVMFMHLQTGVTLDGVAFLGLGRTDARRAHTFPILDPDGRTVPGSDDNTIGRYAVHFHVRSGARADAAPHIVRNCVVIDSPKYGIVNHGGNVLVEDNISIRVTGSHYVAENGSEIGSFRRNLAIRSTGSGEKLPEARMSSYDFGHGGHGIWSQGGGVAITDNWISGQYDAGIFMMGMPFKEEGREVYFDAANIGGSPYADEQGRIKSMDVSFNLARNVVAASGEGLEIWYHKVYSADKRPRELSVVDGLSVFNVQAQAVKLSYSANIALRNLHLFGHEDEPIGIDCNALTESISVDGAEIRDFAVGMRLPQRGQNIVRNATLANTVDLDIPPLSHEGRHILIDNVDFRNPTGTHINLQDSAPLYNDLALLFEPDVIDLTDRLGRNQRLFFPYQDPRHVLFPPGENGPAAVRGLTGAEIDQRFGLAAGGALAPAGAGMLARSNALAATAAADPGENPDRSKTATDANHAGYDSFSSRWKHFTAHLDAKETEGWQLQPTAAKPQLVYASQSPAKFMIRRSLLPLRIHPNDLRYGYRVDGLVLESVDGHMTRQPFERVFKDLTTDPNGFAKLRFDIFSMAGIKSTVELAVQVTTDTVRRGSNVDYYNQREYCGTCGLKSLDEDAQRFLATGELKPLPDFAELCKSPKMPRDLLNRPFQKESGFAYSVKVSPTWRDGRDDVDPAHWQEIVVCEDDHPLAKPGSDVDDIRRAGVGRHVYWADQVVFSTSDGSDPNSNGHVYALAH